MLSLDVTIFSPSEDPPKAACDMPKRSSAARKGDGSSYYIGIPSDRNSILKNSQGVVLNALSPNRNTNTPYGNIEHTTNAAAAPMVVPCRSTPTSVGHVAATRVTPQQQGAA